MNLKLNLPFQSQLQKFAKIEGKIPKTILFPFAIFTVLIFVMVSPMVSIKLHKSQPNFGDSLVCTELTRCRTLRHNENQRKKLILIYIINKNLPNSYLRRYWKRCFFVVGGNWAWLLNAISVRFQNFNSKLGRSTVDFEGFLSSKIEPSHRFNSKEISAGKDFLRTVCPTEKFICLNIRDASFDLCGPAQKKIHQAKREEYRNSKSWTYLQASEVLANMNFTVIRMGSIVKEPLASKHPRVIDYATNGMRTEFLDIFLAAQCAFTVSNGTGWDAAPLTFRRPVIYVNHLPISGPQTLSYPVIIYPKILVDQKSGDLVNLKNAIGSNVSQSRVADEYTDAGVEIRDLSPEELVEAVTEMAQRVEGTFVETPEQKEMQAKLKHILSTHPKLQPSPNYYPIRAQFASCFLSRYPNFLDGLD